MPDYTVFSNPRTGEAVTRIDHPSGLTIYVWPKEGYQSHYAVFGTHYGSIDATFMLNGQLTEVPAGIAHYLEHKLFENEDCDAFQRYAATGADANAFTSFERTAYLFSGTGDITPSLEILLDFVQAPYFTDETVEKERGIIGQEIATVPRPLTADLFPLSHPPRPLVPEDTRTHSATVLPRE